MAEFEHRTDSHRRCLVEVELQARPEADMLERLGEYALRLHRKLCYGPGTEGKCPVLALVLNLTVTEQPRRLDMSVPEWGGAGQWQHVAQGTLAEERAAEALARIKAGELEPCRARPPRSLKGRVSFATKGELLVSQNDSFRSGDVA